MKADQLRHPLDKSVHTDPFSIPPMDINDVESANHLPVLSETPIIPKTNGPSSKIDVCLIFVLLFALGLLSFSTYYFIKSSTASNEVVSALIPQPFTENNDFMFFHLPNQMKVLLVRPNQNINQTYISLSVGIGSEHDPRDFIGFTHLIEHLLFTGSRNFAEQHYIETIVNKYQGEQNGVTKAFATSYFYKIQTEGLEEFIPALADAIENPTFSEENILKEINNVNSEISMRMTYNKNLAYYKLLKKIGNPNSRIFSDGFANIDTKSLNVTELRQKIVDFHQKYYSANLMTLAVITDEDFKTVRLKIERSFNQITDKQLVRPFFNDTNSYEIPLEPMRIGQIYYLKAFTAPSKFTMIFQVGSGKKDARFQPVEFFSIFLNYFAEKSLKQTMIRENLITTFDDTVAYEDYVRALYTVSFHLTDYGRDNISKVVRHFFRFVKYVESIPNKEQIFQSLSKTSKYAFLFNIKSEFIDFSNVKTDFFDRVLQFSENLLDYSPEMIFTVNNVLFGFNQTQFDDVLSMINPLNAVYIIEDTQFKEDTTPKQRKTRVTPLHQRTNIRTKRTRKLVSPKMSFLSGAENFEEVQQTDSSKLASRILSSTEPNIERTLSNVELVQSTSEDIEYVSFFDGTTNNVVLDDNFDFDNNRPYTYRTIPNQSLTQIAADVSQSNLAYDTNAVFDTSHLDFYEAVSECQVPETLKRGYSFEKTPGDSPITLSDKTEKERNAAYTKNVFGAIFNDGTPCLPVDQQFTYLRDLLTYKLCLVKEFSEDDKNDQAQNVHQANRLSVYHSLYRKTLQPKCVITVVLEPETILHSLTTSNYQDKLVSQLRLDILCMYLSKHFELKFHDEYIKGNDFGCRVDNFRIVLTFEGITSQIENFMMVVLSNFLHLATPQKYEPYIIENIKQRVLDGYSQFSSINSIKQSLFYLGLILDKMSVDYSTDAKLAGLRLVINAVNPEALASTMSELLQSNNIIVLGIGNVEQSKIIELGTKARNMLRLSSQHLNHDFNFLKYRNYIHQNFLTSLDYNEHVLVRLENQDKKESNSVYLTYFRIHKVTRVYKLQALVLYHFLKKVIYDELRNKMNLGYVAQAGIKSYYHNLGLIVLVQGESFRPHMVEKSVDTTIANFLDSLSKMSDEEFSKAMQSVLFDLNEFSLNLPRVAEKYFSNMEEQILEENDQTYVDISQTITQTSLYFFAKEFFVNKPRRVTVELFANQISEEERTFKLGQEFNLDKRPYDVVTLEKMLERKAKANQMFK